MSCSGQAQVDQKKSFEVQKSKEEWQQELTKQQCDVLLEKGTERAFSGKYNKHFEDGVYRCAACKNPLYKSDTKYDSGSGWPAFWEPIEGSVDYSMDYSHGMVRTEVHCAKCGGHLGHVFEDGPQPTGIRHCVNSISLDFTPQEE